MASDSELRQLTFKASDFADCVLHNLKLSRSEFYSRLRAGHRIQNNIISHSSFLTQTRKGMSPIEKAVNDENMMNSMTIIDESLLTKKITEVEFSTSNAQILFGLYQTLPGTVATYEGLTTELQSARSAMAAFKTTPNSPPVSDAYLQAQGNTLKLADPVVDWLSSQKQESVGHWELLEYAIDKYDGDILTALGVVGELFYVETFYANPRQEKAFLASRMKPLLVGDAIDPVGYNYHFWRVINASLRKRETKMGSAYNYFSEKSAKDWGDYSANYWGLEIARLILQSAGRKKAACPSATSLPPQAQETMKDKSAP